MLDVYMTWKRQERSKKMSYKEQIIEMVEGIENTATLKYLLCVIESYLKSRRILES